MINKLRDAISAKDISRIRAITQERPVADIAHAVEKLTQTERIIFFRLLKTDQQSDIFAHLSPKVQEDLVRSFTDEQIDEIIGDLYADEIADLIEEVPNELQKTIILSINDKETREKVNKILKYSEDQTGSFMNVDIVTLIDTMTVRETLEKIKSERHDSKLDHFFFVTNNQKNLLGYVAFEDIVFAEKDILLQDLIKSSPSVKTNTLKEEAAQTFAKYDMTVLPVVDAHNVLVGMITADDVIDIFEEAATDDVHKAVGVMLDQKSYSKTSILKLFKSRFLWLMLLMISATLSQIVLDYFQSLADRRFNITQNDVVTAGLTSAIVAILPVISGAAGNAGSQSSTMVIRALATGDITTSDYLRVLSKEFGSSLCMGSMLGIANFARLMIYYSATGDIHNVHYIFLSLSASIALFVVIILANIVGGSLPLLAKLVKLDPAVMAAPLLTTLIDALSTMIFFGISIGVMLLVI